MTSDIWGLIAYFVFGALGTFCRVWISPEMELGLNKRAVVEVVVGGVVGFLIPIAGTGLATWSASFDLIGIAIKDASVVVQIIVKGGIVFVLSYAGSLTIGEILARRKP